MSVASIFGDLKFRAVTFGVLANTIVYIDTFIPLTAEILFTTLPISTDNADIAGNTMTFLLVRDTQYNPTTYTLTAKNAAAGEDFTGVVNIWYTE
jgi:hypothetical protein